MAETQKTSAASSEGNGEERRYDAGEILDRARSLTGENRHIVAGALSTSDRKTHTESQIKKLVKDYAGRAEAGSGDDA